MPTKPARLRLPTTHEDSFEGGRWPLVGSCFGCRWFGVLFFVVLMFPGSVRVLAQPLGPSEMASELKGLLDEHATARRTVVCLKIVDPTANRVLFDRHGGWLLTPASNLKVYTTACAMDRLGLEHRFTTRCRAEGSLVDGVLEGNIILVGGGDSMLSTHDLASMADGVVAKWGLRVLRGSVVADNSRYDGRLKGPGWMWDDDPDYYNMSVTPLMLDFNVLRVLVANAGGGTAAAKLIPSADFPPLVILPDRSADDSVEVTREPFTEEIRVKLPHRVSEPVEERLTPHDAGRWIAAVFQRMLSDRGVNIEQHTQPEPGSSRSRSRVIDDIVHSSVPLAEALRRFNKVSENAVGELLLHELAISAGQDRPTWRDGANVISNWLTRNVGLDADSFRIVDGSGLSRYNLISADSCTQLLSYMFTHREAETFRGLLPAYEVDLEGIVWPGKSVADIDGQRVFAKSGGMSGVSTISGYVNTLDDQWLVFSLLTSGFIGSNEQVVDLRNKTWRLLVRYKAADPVSHDHAPTGRPP